jgi:hypothetical protein
MRFRLAWLGVGAIALIACGTNVRVFRGDGGESASSTATSGAGASPSSVTATQAVTSTVDVGAGGVGAGGSCNEVLLDAEYLVRPIDAIVLAESGFQVQEELLALEQTLHPSFAAQFTQAGVDAQIVVVSDHGAGSQELCIGPPLSSATRCSGPPGNVPGQFRHYSVPIGPFDLSCKALDSLHGTLPDEFNLAPAGWVSWLRSNALKGVVAVSESGSWCTWGSYTFQDVNDPSAGQELAIDWDAALLSLSPAQFGTVAQRNYVFHALLGMTAKSNNEPYEPFEAVVTQGCSFQNAPTGYQWLARGTEGLRASTCNPASMGSALSSFALRLIEAATDRCLMELPPAYDPQALELVYHPTSGPTASFTQVPSPARCGPGAFYIEGEVILLCPDTCALVESDPGEIDLDFGCLDL